MMAGTLFPLVYRFGDNICLWTGNQTEYLPPLNKEEGEVTHSIPYGCVSCVSKHTYLFLCMYIPIHLPPSPPKKTQHVCTYVWMYAYRNRCFYSYNGCLYPLFLTIIFVSFFLHSLFRRNYVNKRRRKWMITVHRYAP